MGNEQRFQDHDNLRREAEKRVDQDEVLDVGEMSETDVRALLHELQVHQIELEMQNNELILAKAVVEDALRKYSDLYDFAPVGYLTLDESAIIIEANLAATSMLSLPRSELIGSPFGFFVSPQSRFGINDFFRSILDSSTAGSREMTLLRNGKYPFYALIEIATGELHGECPPLCHITMIDITQRKEAEDALSKAYAELEVRVEERTKELAEARSEAERRAAEIESFMAGMADGVILFDAKGDISFINDNGMDMLRVPGGESFEGWLQRCRIFDLEGNIIADDQEAVHRALQGESDADLRGVLVTPWGKELTLSISASPVLGSEGEIVGATMIFRDQSARILFEKQQQILLERERHIAEVLEQAVIPHADYDVPGCKFAARYVPALDEAGVGGDFYDIFELDNGKVGVLIGDVAGKGLAAAVGIAGIRYAIRSYAYLDPRPSRVMTLTNEALCRGGSGEDYLGMLTAFFAVIDTRFGGISYASGGHEAAVLKSVDGHTEMLQANGPVLGVINDVEYTEQSRRLRPGDVVVMVTDGITEARSDPTSFFCIEGVEQYVADSSEKNLDALAEGILQAAKSYAGGRFKDDAAIVAVSLANGQA